MQETVKERLISYLKSIPMSQKAFCDKIRVSKGYITNMVSGFGRDVLFRIKSEFPDLSINWLLYGEGEMLNSQLPAVEAGGKRLERSTPLRLSRRQWLSSTATGVASIYYAGLTSTRISSRGKARAIMALTFGGWRGEAAAGLDTLLGALFLGDLCRRT